MYKRLLDLLQTKEKREMNYEMTLLKSVHIDVEIC